MKAITVSMVVEVFGGGGGVVVMVKLPDAYDVPHCVMLVCVRGAVGQLRRIQRAMAFMFMFLVSFSKNSQTCFLIFRVDAEM